MIIIKKTQAKIINKHFNHNLNIVFCYPLFQLPFESSKKLPWPAGAHSYPGVVTSLWTYSTSWRRFSPPFLEEPDSLVFPKTCKPNKLTQNYIYSCVDAFACSLWLSRLIFCLSNVQGFKNATVVRSCYLLRIVRPRQKALAAYKP